MVVREALLLTLFVGALGTHDLSSTYPFRLDLHDNYTLYWTFDNDAQNITFAVRVRTTGWVGFGVSPNGQMPQSDVVIGWVDGTGNHFDVSRHLIYLLYELNLIYRIDLLTPELFLLSIVSKTGFY